MVGRAGRAQRRNGVAKAMLGECHDVHIAFDDEGIAPLAHRLPALVEAIELAALVEDRCLGRVQVFGLALVQHAAAEADDFALHIADREHDAVAEPVIAFRVLARFRVGRDDEA